LALYKFEDKQDIVTQPNKVPPILVIIGQMPFLRGGCIIVCAADSDQGTLIPRTLPSHTILRLRIVEQPLKWVAHPLGILIPLGSPPQEPSTIRVLSPCCRRRISAFHFAIKMETQSQSPPRLATIPPPVEDCQCRRLSHLWFPFYANWPNCNLRLLLEIA